MGKPLDLAGSRYNGIEVLRKLEARTASRKVLWECRCECGRIWAVETGGLRNGSTKSCGCKRSARAAQMGREKRQHGLGGTKIYNRWRGMIRRCHEPGYRHYPKYGGRGIIVCDEWRNSIEAFIRDMGLPEDGMSIDRIDVNGNYEPGNCRWATDAEQNRNKRSNRQLTFQGITKCTAEWERDLGFEPTLISGRLKRGWTIEKALTTKVRANKN